jgi:hypothetical protein
MEETNWAAGGCYFESPRGSGLYKAYCRDLHCFETVPHSPARSVTICHQFRHSHTHTRPWGSWGMRREVCAGGTVCVCAPASLLRDKTDTTGRGHCTWRRFVLEGNGKIFLVEEREGVWFGLWDTVCLWADCGAAVGMTTRITSISVTLFILKEPKGFMNYTQTALPLNGRHFSFEIWSSSDKNERDRH